MRRLPRHDMMAVHDDDLAVLMESLGVDRKFARGDLGCKFCRKPVTEENLSSLFRQSGDIKYVCDDAECLHRLYLLIRSGEVRL